MIASLTTSRLASVVICLIAFATSGSGAYFASLPANANAWTVFAPIRTPPILYAPSGIAIDPSANVLAPLDGQLWTIPATGRSAGPRILTGDGASGRFGGVAVDSSGNIFLTDQQDRAIRELTPEGGLITTWGGQASDSFNRPLGVAVSRGGDVYLADTNDLVIKKLSPSGETLESWQAAAAPVAVALDSMGNVYVVDVSGDLQEVQVFNPDGAIVRQWGEKGDAPGLFDDPVGIAVDTAGNVYVAEQGSNRIQKFSSTGTSLAIWGGPDRRGRDPNQFGSVTGIAVDASDNVYVADGGNGRITKLSPNGAVLATMPVPLPASISCCVYPEGVAVDLSGDVWVTSSPNEVVQLSSSGQVLNLWSRQGITPGTFAQPAGIARDAQGNIFVTDTSNNWIQRLSRG